jgi:hypothetical protein
MSGPPDGGRRWQARAFGVDLDLGFATPALPPLPDGRRPDDPTVVELGEQAAIDAAWPAEEARRSGIMGTREDPVMEVHEHVTAGYRIALPPYGCYLVSGDGRRVTCAPPDVPDWDWQRLLVGQVLPAVAAVRDYELLHASAVELGDRAIAFAGPPGLGKSSLALRLMLRGRRLVAEDVLAIDVRDGRVVAEPGAAMLNIRDEELAALDPQARGALGDAVGRSRDEKVHVISEREDRALPLAALYLLERGDPGTPVFERLEEPRAADLFTHSFVTYVYRSGRMVRQLDIAATVARTVPVFRLRVQAGVSATALAERVEEHAGAAG